MEDLSIPATLNEAISTEPLWILAWVMLVISGDPLCSNQGQGRLNAA